MNRFFILLLAVLFAATLSAQNVGVDQNNPLNKLDVNGNLSVGSGYSGVRAAPVDGAIFQGSVGIGLTVPETRLHINGADNDGTTATLKITAGTQHMLLDGNEIDVADNGDLFLQNNTSGNVLLSNGGGKVGIGIGSVPADASLMVNGNIRVANDSDIFGVNEIFGFNDLKFSADPTGGPDFRIGAPGYAAFGAGFFSNVALNIRNIPNNTGGQIINVELNDGTNIFQIQADQDFFVIGDFYVNNGTKNFIMDHPLDPANKSLAHNAIEGPAHITYYHGTAIMGADGSAQVNLPDYFEALNKDFHYQLTCVGGFAQVYVSEEIRDNQFTIAGGTPGLKVSWQVTAERNDPWAKNHPYEAEIEKEGAEKGKYWYPEGYGLPKSMLINNDVEAN